MNEFLLDIDLPELIADFQGVVMGISAGTMNAAREVYAWPELPGESEDPNYVLFFPGLGLAETMVLPHYQKARYTILDGKKLVEEIACGHSYGKRYFAIPDGSYVLVKDGKETVFGQAWLITEGCIHLFCEDGQSRDCGRVRKRGNQGCGSLFLCVQEPDTGGQVAGESDPQQIRDLKPGGQSIGSGKGSVHGEDQQPQQDQPEEGQSKSLEVKENWTPEKVYCQLQKEQQYPPCPDVSGGVPPHPGRTYAHQGV